MDSVFFVLYWGCLGLIVFQGSQYALAFPAVALGRRDFTGIDSLATTRPLRNDYRFGFIVSLLPFAGAAWVSYWLLVKLSVAGWGNPNLLTNVTRLAVTGFGFLALASCATYLSNVYAQKSLAPGASSTT